jgi:tRNA(Ile)-lysidine synthase
MNSLINKVKKTLIDHSMVESGERVLVAVSGGPDSVALLHSLVELRREIGIELKVVHLNHSARGVESDSDARFVDELGKSLDIETLIETKDVPSEHINSKYSFQETARKIRMEFFESALKVLGGHKLALGHTQDDQVETVLMNLLRGSGLKGLGGMNPVRFPYIRPLFNCSRADIIEFLNKRKIPYCQDSSNEKSDYLRNRIRLELIPYLQKNYNSKITRNLFETSEIFRDDNGWLDGLVKQEFKQLASVSEHNGRLDFEIKTFLTFPKSLQMRLIREALRFLKGDLRRIAFRHIQQVLQLFHVGQKGKKIDLPDRIQVQFIGDRVTFKRIPEPTPIILKVGKNKGDLWHLNVPGETPVGDSGVILKAKLIDRSDADISQGSSKSVFLDFDKTGEEILIRFFQPGDRIQPLGMNGTKKVKSLFIDEKIPRESRTLIPILTTIDNDIIWVYGLRVAHPYRVTATSKNVLLISGLP